jgi:hypothetical protein
MAINKNFVVKNGLEVNTSLILADASSEKVGIGSTIPNYKLDVAGGIGATDVYVGSAATVVGEFNVGTDGSVLTVLGVGGSVGVGTALPGYLLEVRSPVSTGQTALYVYGDMRVTGDINLDDITLDHISGTTLNISGIATIGELGVSGVTTTQFLTVTGVSTFSNDIDLNASIDVSNNLNVAGVATIATLGVAGLTTTNNLYVYEDTYVVGVVTANSFYGDGSNLTGIATNLTATVGVGSESSFIGAGITQINFNSTNGTAISVDVPPATSAGVATVTFTPGVSLGLAIALGG